jgi:ATP-dependent 26S proteasome regulatory subunit
LKVGLPDLHGRAQILRIHTAKMRQEGLLAPCVDIDVLAGMTSNYSGAEIKAGMCLAGPCREPQYASFGLFLLFLMPRLG